MVRTRRIRLDTSKVSAATAKVWQEVDKVWEEVDKVFAEADRIMAATPDTEMKTDKDPKLHFEPRNKKERWQMFRRFFMMSWKVLFTGKADLTYKKRS